MEYYSPTDLNEAYSLLDKYGEDAIPIAGSTFYMGHREELFDEVEAVINIKQLGLSYIRQDGDGLRIGATTTLNEIFAHELTSKGTFGILAETVKELNINEVRNMATIGGEVCIAGEVDMPTTLLAYDANIVIGGSKGVREMSMADFHIGYLNNALEPGEMVLEVHIPQPPANTGAGFAKFERTAADLPIVNVATRISLDNVGACAEARVVAGAATLSGVPERSAAAETALLNKVIDGTLIETAAAASGDIACIHDFRVSAEIRSLWVKCGIEDALQRAVAAVQ
ncbi:MAG: FAD binding domain-containing protein [Gammaproteobacteria bacterium]|nr:FAD binding domain-containing protein [Gammaproteobacteria bacterium]MDE0286391.1 FAD binding domain-containing protein [Gammaproteobacteria bacterium]MDE0514192.1 FAD binding domain-containing protein [Gammaproteobacteria bacterium]